MIVKSSRVCVLYLVYCLGYFFAYLTAFVCDIVPASLHVCTFCDRFSSNDQDNLKVLTESWQRDEEKNIFFQPSIENKERFLLAIQTSFQQHLLKRYGNELCCLDATYKTSKFALCLFFVAVKTNSDYQVGNFI